MNPHTLFTGLKINKPWPDWSHNVLVIYWSKTNYPQIQQRKTTQTFIISWFLQVGLMWILWHWVSHKAVVISKITGEAFTSLLTQVVVGRIHLPLSPWKETSLPFFPGGCCYRAPHNRAACFIRAPARKRARETSKIGSYSLLQPNHQRGVSSSILNSILQEKVTRSSPH